MSIIAKVPGKHVGVDRFLIFILAGIGLLILAAVVSVALLKSPAPEPAVNSPSGVVKQFLVAIDKEEYNQAYSLLTGDMTKEATLNEFMNFNTRQYGYREQLRYQLGAENINGNSATVRVTITSYYENSSPFGSNQYSYQEVFRTERLDGNWQISYLPGRFFPYDKYLGY